ncbi:MAG TPA: 2-hydroxychromene-2-carboxylate isomerase [Steroidobacteraceae bacterium]|nr:2-hydroxychromene-2-carboxylate isomerase [Steroidobacteraceae bacterium]
MGTPTHVIWVYDVLSPFAYLSLPRLPEFSARVTLEARPVLLGALLDHFGQRGPAEISAKRRFTYRFALWRARQLKVPMRFPPSHPFNPLAALRLIIAAGSTVKAAETTLNAVFRDGRDLSDPKVIEELAGELGVADPQAKLADPAVKSRLRENTDWAIAHGVFGVPTLVIGEEIFWGHDAIDMALDYLRDPEGFRDAQMRAIEALPIGIERRR